MLIKTVILFLVRLVSSLRLVHLPTAIRRISLHYSRVCPVKLRAPGLGESGFAIGMVPLALRQQVFFPESLTPSVR